ncbi:unnamed protein product [Ectocarpus fasciculatus]
MVKAGGTTVKSLIQSSMKRTHSSMGLYTNHHWMRDRNTVKNGETTAKSSITYGAYTEALRPHEGRDCKWFTIFRHPISRLVSAYFYCKQNGWDELCASMVLKAGNTDLHTFAKHWGNYGLRQFSLAFVEAGAVFAAEQERGVDGRPVMFPGWFRVKEYFENQFDVEQERALKQETGASNDLAMSYLLQPVEDLLSRNYSAVGILEKWGTSMNLFNKALGVPNFNWQTASRNLGRKNVDKRLHNEEAQALRAAWDDPVLAKTLWLDILLYDHAVTVHNKQVEEHGIV